MGRKRLRLKIFAREEYLDDVEILQKQLHEAGYIATKEDISFAWEARSGEMCAGWLVLNKDPQKNVNAILKYFEEV